MMLKTITPREMKRVENRAMADNRASGEALMLRAAEGVAEAARELLGARPGPVLCLCGTGNNGGDGLCAMRLLACADERFEGECWILRGELSPDAQRELARLRAQAPRVKIVTLEGDAPPECPRAVLVIDALFGTGLSRPLEGMAKTLCELVGQSGASVLAVDIPSGLSGQTGETLGACARADVTVTFHRPKPGLYLGQGPDFAGRVIVRDIGLPRDIDDADGLWLLQKPDLARLLPPRKRVSHKGSYGRALLWVGSRGLAGAAGVCAMAALRAGAGLVTVACPEEIVDIVQTLCPCATCAPIPMGDANAAWAALEAAMSRADCVAAGCGLGRSQAAGELLARLIAAAKARQMPCVLDADALNMLAENGALAPVPIAASDFALYLTPHPAEAARLLGASTADILRDPVASAGAIGARYGANVILKGAASVLVSPGGAAISPFGTPGMAKGGSGDALTGVLAALLAGRAAGAYGMNDLETMQAACALHGLAGEQAAARFGERGLLATDLCEELGRVRP